jgi:hypothetical protein
LKIEYNLRGGDNMKRFFKYLFSSFIIIVILFFSARITTELKSQFSQTYNADFYIIFSWLFPILLGMLLRLPQLVNDIIQKKRLSVDWIKLIAIGLPFFYLSSIPLMYLDIPIIYPEFAIVFIFTNFTATQIAGVILGYIILDSLKVKNR